MTVYGKVIDGQFVPDNPQAFIEAIKKREGKRTQLKIQAISKNRTTKQNALMWKVFEFAGEELGYTKEELHDTFKAMFTTDPVLNVVRGTRNMTTVEHIRFIDQCVQKLAEMGCIIPIALVD